MMKPSKLPQHLEIIAIEVAAIPADATDDEIVDMALAAVDGLSPDIGADVVLRAAFLRNELVERGLASRDAKGRLTLKSKC